MNAIKKIGLYAIAVVAMIITMASCSDIEYPNAPQRPTVSDLKYTVDGRSVTLTWTLPQRDDIVGVQVVANNTDAVDLEGAATSYFVKRAIAGEEICYTVKIKYADGTVSEGQTVRFVVEAVPAKIGYLISYNSVDEIEDDDEQASARWFQANVPNGVVLTPADLFGITPDDYSVIMIHVDRTFIGVGYDRLPASLISAETIGNLRAFLKDGGNIFLANHATQLVVPLGRIDEQYAPRLFADGDGGDGTDVWTINANIGIGVYDHRSHRHSRTGNGFGHRAVVHLHREVSNDLGTGARRCDCCSQCQYYFFHLICSLLVIIKGRSRQEVLRLLSP